MEDALLVMTAYFACLPNFQSTTSVSLLARRSSNSIATRSRLPSFSINSQASNSLIIGSGFALSTSVHSSAVYTSNVCDTQLLPRTSKAALQKLDHISGYHSAQIVFSKWGIHDYLIARVLAITEWNMLG